MMLAQWFHFDSGAGEPAFNMALDEALMQSVAAFGVPVKILNDAAMQAIGSHRAAGLTNEKMLFLGLGTGLGTCMIAGRIVLPMEQDAWIEAILRLAGDEPLRHRLHGRFRRRCDGRLVQRFRCHACQRTFEYLRQLPPPRS